ncbi:MAG: iron ABC transporter permease [Spirochaetaceae bacterium]|nr:MAG: iron ABC transporter permease [Spirochaetaceae bacterium]
MRGGGRAHRSGWDFWSYATLGASLVFLLLLVYPLVRLLLASFLPEAGTFAAAGEDFGFFDTYIHFFSSRYYYSTLYNSFFVATLAAIFSLVIGTIVAYIVSRIRIPGRLLLRVAVVMVFVSPPFIGAYAWVLLLGRMGIITRVVQMIGITLPDIYGWRGIVLVFTLQAFPFVFLLVSSGLKSIDQSLEDAAVNLGRTHLGAFFTVFLPLMIPSISTGALLVFVTAFADFGTPMIIGEGFRVLSQTVYTSFINEFGGNPRFASTLAVLMLIVTISALLIQRNIARRWSFGQEAVTPLRTITASRPVTIAASVVVYGIVIAASLPSITIIVSSFLRSVGPMLLPEFTLEGYTRAVRLPRALRNTAVFASTATVLCVLTGTIMGYVVSRRRGRVPAMIDSVSMVPYAVAGVVLGVALLISFGGRPFYLTGTGTILVLAYFIRRLPYTVRSTAGMLHQTGVQTEEASINLGVPPGRTFLKITVPIISPSIIAGALLTWATVSREFNSTVMLYSGRTRTLSVEVFGYVLYGSFGQASVVGTVLLLVAVIPIILMFRLFGRGEESLV